ncbi:MAG: hypothetical protein G01um101470_958 [Parcubacteria group bacterium Gr01-1014_70]|nr:MAG: hypothetical protein G01um101470_958 [Parcubacteria group bacterium Gr01-1014_70]
MTSWKYGLLVGGFILVDFILARFPAGAWKEIIVIAGMIVIFVPICIQIYRIERRLK